MKVYGNRIARDRAYDIRSGRTSRLQLGTDKWLVKIIVGVRRIFHREEHIPANERFYRRMRSQTYFKLERSLHNFNRGKVLLFITCVDCGIEVETLYSDRKRCDVCRKARIQSVHGGDARRCARFGVPYDSNVNRMLVLERDNWICHVCGLPAPKEKRGTNEDDSPEVDHVHPLGAVIDGKKSPGHVLSNVRCIHRKCNIEKNKNFKYRERGTWDAFYQEGLKNKKANGTWLANPGSGQLTEIICLICGKLAVKLRKHAKYCSEECCNRADNFREASKRIRGPWCKFPRERGPHQNGTKGLRRNAIIKSFAKGIQ